MALTPRRASYGFLCAAPFLFIATAIRVFHIPGWHQAIAVTLCAAIFGAGWILGARRIASSGKAATLALAGGLLITSFGFGSLYFVGLGPPWEATPEENRTRYLVLLVMSIVVVGGLIALREALAQAGEHVYSTVGFIATLLAGPLFVIWALFDLSVYVAILQAGKPTPAMLELNGLFEAVLFLAGALTYLATAAFALSLGRVRWIGPWAAGAYTSASLLALLCLSLRGLSFPDPSALSTPWYTQPGFIVGIPAIPFLMPFWLGVVLLRRAGDARDESGVVPNQ